MNVPVFEKLRVNVPEFCVGELLVPLVSVQVTLCWFDPFHCHMTVSPAEIVLVMGLKTSSATSTSFSPLGPVASLQAARKSAALMASAARERRTERRMLISG